MKSFKRIDRFVEFAVYSFADWIAACEWRGKERDCVNIFASKFILPSIGARTAVTDYSQVRIECAVPQPLGYIRPAAAKDLVIWTGALDVAWDEHWNARYVPLVVMEWKTRRKGQCDPVFDTHDVQWLTAFTRDNPDAYGYAVTVDFRKLARRVHCARFRGGIMKVNRRLERRR